MCLPLGIPQADDGEPVRVGRDVAEEEEGVLALAAHVPAELVENLVAGLLDRIALPAEYLTKLTPDRATQPTPNGAGEKSPYVGKSI